MSTQQNVAVADIHPIDRLLRADRLPHILCAGCGIGTVIHGYAHAIAVYHGTDAATGAQDVRQTIRA